MAVFWVVSPVVWLKVTYEEFLSYDILIALMMESESISETSVNVNWTTRRNNLEDDHLSTLRHENLKSHCI
jgi:hypothetical protein